MKPLFVAFLLLFNAAPLFAGEEVGDPGYIPDYQELVREGYGPRHDYREGYFDRDGYYLRLGYGYTTAPKPTQAYYGKGYTIYYGYTTVMVPWGQPHTDYAFGYPLEYFRRLMPSSVNGVNLSHYAIEVRNSVYGPGDFVAQSRSHRDSAITTVQRVTTTTTTTAPASGANPLPAIGEKPAQ
jgi:hypothetical protein